MKKNYFEFNLKKNSFLKITTLIYIIFMINLKNNIKLIIGFREVRFLVFYFFPSKQMNMRIPFYDFYFFPF